MKASNPAPRLAVPMVALMAACASSPAPWLVDTRDVAPGEECPAGGVAMVTGPDDNGDGALSDAEVAQSEVVCHGEDGSTMLIRVDEEPQGDPCPLGGLAVHAGLDLDGDLQLDDDEIEGTRYVCRGPAGELDVDVVHGIYVLEDGIDLALLDGVHTIDGYLAIESAWLREVVLPDLQQVGLVYTDPCDRLQRVELPALVDATEEGVFFGACPELTTLDLSGLEHAGYLSLEDLPLLDDLDASAIASLERLELIGVPAGPDMTWLGPITSLAGDEDDDIVELQLVDTDLESLEGLDDLQSVAGPVFLGGNEHLATLQGLSGLRTVDRFVVRDNPVLADVSAAHGITSVQGDLVIRDNPGLPTCAAEALRDAIGAANIAGDIDIAGNDADGTCP